MRLKQDSHRDISFNHLVPVFLLEIIENILIYTPSLNQICISNVFQISGRFIRVEVRDIDFYYGCYASISIQLSIFL